jgi:hypothetical protein
MTAGVIRERVASAESCRLRSLQGKHDVRHCIEELARPKKWEVV